MDQYPELYLEGIRLFNAEEFYECHDALEELWTDTVGEERLFLQGLIQAAVALFHFGNDNFGAARKLYHASTEKLANYQSPYWGLDLDRFFADFEHCFQELLEAESYPTAITLRKERVPKLKFEL